MREFVTAAKEVTEEEQGTAGLTEFTLDGTTCVAKRPKDGQVAILLATTSRQMKEVDRVAGVINFFTSTLDDKSYTYIVNRLLDGNDPLGLPEVEAPYQVAVRLYAIAAGRWAELDAEYASIDMIRLPPHRFLNLVFAWCVRRFHKQEDLEQWMFQLEQPLPGDEKKKPSQTDLQAESDSFMSLMAKQG
jgi:hypothetical protein